MKIVSIGNSFSCNIHRVSHQVAAAAGADLQLVNAHHSGCTMLMHSGYIRNNEPAYHRYENGVKVVENVTLDSILSSGTFDYVTIQPGSGGWKKYGRIPDDFPYIHEIIATAKRYQPQATIVYNHYWADSDCSTRTVFAEFFRFDRRKMLDWWQGYADRAAALPDVRFVCPCGRAIEEAYPEFRCRLYKDDGYHLGPVGEYLEACLWTEYFGGVLPTPDFVPGNVEATPEEAAHLRAAAHRACLSCAEPPARPAR